MNATGVRGDGPPSRAAPIVVRAVLSAWVLAVLVAVVAMLFTGGWFEELASGRIYDSTVLAGGLLLVQLVASVAVVFSWVRPSGTARAVLIGAAALQLLIVLAAGCLLVLFATAPGPRMF